MAENARPPVAIRIVRPYESEDELLEHELDTIGKTSVILIGAHSRPTGVILRFEVTLQNGASVLRGEGRVLAHKENAFRGQSGLTLRFTRLDPKSKAVVDRATSMREARAGVASPIAQALSVETPAAPFVAPAMPTPSPPRPVVDQAANVQSALDAAREKANAQARANAKRTSRTPPPLPSGTPRVSLTPPPPLSIPLEVEPEPEPEAPPPPPVSLSIPPPPESLPILVPDSEPMIPVPIFTDDAVTAVPGEVAPKADRSELLARLRRRSAGLPADRVQAIFESGRALKRTPGAS